MKSARDTPAAVSVIIAVYNGARFIAESLDSVLGQREKPFEVIVVDDGSTDDTARIVQQYAEVIYVAQANAGQPSALNKGITLAQSTLLAFNDADDVWTADKLERQLAVLRHEPDVDVVFGHAEQFLEPDAPGSVVAALTADRRIVPSFLPTAMLIRREAFDRVGDFDVSQRIGAVVDWYHRAQSVGLRSHMLEHVVLRRRLHGANLGWTHRDEAKAAYLAVARRALARRRIDGGSPPLG